MATIKKDHIIMEKLKITELRHYVAQTNKGDLTLMLRKGENKYKLVLDAVPLEEELNNEIMELLYPSKSSEIIQSIPVKELINEEKPKQKSYYKPKKK